MSDNKSTREQFAEGAETMFGENVPPDEPAKEAPEPENTPSPMGSAENYSSTPARDLFAMQVNEAMANGFSDDSGLWRRII